MSKNITGNIKASIFAGIIAIFVAITGSSALAHFGETGVTRMNPDKVEWGLQIYTAPNGTVYLLGLDGRVVNQWGTLADQILWAKPIFDPGGDILTMVEPATFDDYVAPIGTKLVQFDVDGNRFFEWGDYELSGGYFIGFHHYMQRLPNGNTLAICLTAVTVPSISPDLLLDDCLVELDWEGNIVWEWYTYEHFDQFGFDDAAKQRISEAAGDWAHANSVSIIPENSHSDPAFTPGNIMVGYRGLNTVVIINRQSGDIVWKMGPNDSQTIGQHDAYMIDPDLPGAGNIMVFDNGLSAGYPPVSRAFSQVLEINPVSRVIEWRYNAAFSGLQPWYFFSPIVSGAQRLANGNTVITEGTKGRLFEVTQSGEIVWEFLNPYFDTSGGPNGPVRNYSVFRSYRMPLHWGWPSTPL